MGKALRYLAVASVCFILNGCSHLPKNIWFESTEQLVEDKQFAKAISKIETQQPVNKKQLRSVKRQASRYRQQQIRTINKLMTSKQWGQAQNIITKMTLSQPEHKSWQSIQKKLNHKKAQEQRIIDTEVALLQAKQLKIRMKQADFENRSVTGSFNWFTQDSTLAEERLDLAEWLIALSTAALEQQDYGRAQTTYAKAIELNQEIKASKLDQDINQGLTAQNDSSVLKRQTSLLKKLKNAMEQEDFPLIAKYQRILSRAPFKGKQVTKSLAQAKALRQRTAKLKDKQADKIYRQGEVKQAISLWQQVQLLDPQLKGIKDKLQRSLKVQKKMQTLIGS